MRSFNGVLPFYRRDFQTYKHLNSNEKVLRWGILSNMVWNEVDHPDRYGVAEISQKELADYVSWTESKVSRVLPKLLKKNPGFARDGDKYIADDFDAFVYRVACQREKVIREKQRQAELEQLAKRKASVSESKEQVSTSQFANGNQTDVTPSSDITSDSFKGYSLGEDNVVSKETFAAKKQRLLANGHNEQVLMDPCFCGSGKRFIDCCADFIDEVLPPNLYTDISDGDSGGIE